MTTLLAIIAHPKDNDLLSRHWPYFKMTGFDILGCGPESGPTVAWPEYVNCLNTGQLGTRMTPAGSSIWGLVRQELDIWEFFLTNPWCAKYDSLCIVEPDNLFVRKPPQHPGNGLYLVTVLPNYATPGLFKTPVYFSTPRWGDRECIRQMYAHGTGMYDRGDVEHWISDRFPALVCHQGHIPWLAQPAWSPLPLPWNGATKETWIRDAQAAIQVGCYCLHSVKHEWQLEALKDLIVNSALCEGAERKT